MSPSGTTPVFAIDALNQGTALCAAEVGGINTQCPANVPINSAGEPLFVTGNPGAVTDSALLAAAQAGTIADDTAFTPGTSSVILIGCPNGVSNVTANYAGALQCTPDRMVFTNTGKWGGVALGAATAWGTAPSGMCPAGT
jgi:hypothetical protein